MLVERVRHVGRHRLQFLFVNVDHALDFFDMQANVVRRHVFIAVDVGELFQLSVVLEYVNARLIADEHFVSFKCDAGIDDGDHFAAQIDLAVNHL